jgi:uncharacterized membrane protein AbrB (regulator of aidB expression)
MRRVDRNPWPPGGAGRIVAAQPTRWSERQMTPVLAALGILLILFAIPLGLMLAPLILGAILLVVGLRRASRAFQPMPASVAGEPA